MMADAKAKPPGSIGGSDLYTIDELQRRLGISSWSMRRAQRHGLRVYKIARTKYVLGRDYIAYVESTGKH
jgi:hypothetical protein